MTLKRFKVTVFDRLDWEWRSFDIVAENELEVRAYMDKRFNPEFRHFPYRRGEEDSLEIRFDEDVEIPIVTEDRDYGKY